MKVRLKPFKCPASTGIHTKQKTDPSFLSPRGASSLAEITLMADILPFNQSLIVLGRRKKKDEEKKRNEALQPSFSSLRWNQTVEEEGGHQDPFLPFVVGG